MTTPARNINTYLNRQGYFYQKLTCAGGESLATTTSNHWKQYVDIRPASVNNPMGASGWRNPSGWSHDHLEAVVSPIGGMQTKTWCANKYQFTGNRHVDGEYATDTGILTYLVGPPAWVSNLATSRAYLALKNQQCNLSEVFFTRRETQELFASNVKAIAKSVENFRKNHPELWEYMYPSSSFAFDKGKDIKGLRKIYQARRDLKKVGWLKKTKIPSRFLELMYGWKPLMSDVFGACQVLDTAQSDTRAYHARAKGSAKLVERFNVQLASSPYYWIETVERTHHVKVLLYYVLNNPALASFASLGVTNPLELGWELTRLSFVVDWFLPIGNWLSTLDADFGWRYETGVNSTFSKLSMNSVPKTIPNNASNQYTNYTVGPSAKGIRFRRTVLGSPPGVGLPHFKNPLSSLHVAEAMSLLVQAFRK